MSPRAILQNRQSSVVVMFFLTSRDELEQPGARLLEWRGLVGALAQEGGDGLHPGHRFICQRIGAALVSAEQDEIALALVGRHELAQPGGLRAPTRSHPA